jgi:hypothetical protein
MAFPIQKANLPNLPEILIQILQAEAWGLDRKGVRDLTRLFNINTSWLKKQRLL